MIAGALATVYVSDMDRAVRFYTETLGLRLAYRFGNHWASVDAGRGTMIGLHPATPHSPGGRRGSISIGLEVTEPIERVVETLAARGVTFDGPITDDKAGRFAPLSDPDGNPLYLFETRSDDWKPESGGTRERGAAERSAAR